MGAYVPPQTGGGFDPFAPEAEGPITRTFPDGTLRQWTGTQWQIIGAPPQKVAGAPAQQFDAGGQAWVWSDSGWVRAPQFDNPTKAAGYQAPRAPTPPQTFTDRNGDVVGLDPFTGVEVYRIAGADWPKISPQEQERIRQGDLQTARNWDIQTRAADWARADTVRAEDRTFTQGENATDRAFRAGESAADRAQRAAEFAAQQDANDRSLDVQVQTANRGLQRQSEQDRLAAARQYADLVSSYDTAALPAYLAAGGGSVVNARQANPGGLLTDNAIRPAAQSLDQARNTRYDPITLQPRAPMTGATAAANALRITPPESFTALGTGENSAARRGPNGEVIAYTPGQPPVKPQQQSGNPFQDLSYIETPDTSFDDGSTGTGYSVDDQTFQDLLAEVMADPNTTVQGFARGTRGFIRAPRQFRVGEVGPEMMEVHDPPGPNNAQLRVTPEYPVPKGGFRRQPGFALGTLADPGGTGIPVAPGSATTPASSGGIQPMAVYNSQASPASVLASTASSGDPYVDEVRAFRRGLQPLNVGANPYDPRFTRQVAPLLQQAYYANEQTRTGIPGDVIAFDAERFRPRGFDRSAVRMRY